jgi:hypothetical protein
VSLAEEAEAIMTEETGTVGLLARLERFGNPRETWKWETGEVDYVAQLGLTAGDVPELLAVARKWAEPMDWPDDEDYVAGYAPIHAWRGLAQLGAAEAIPLLLEMMGPLDEAGDDWYLEEFPHAFAWIGPASLGPLSDYLADAAHAVYPRVAAGSGLRELAKRHPESREAAVKALCRTLAGFQENDEGVNGFIVSDLLDLKATEAAELIERAHAADRVDVTISGNWNDVRKELGVSGLGLVPEELANMQWGWAHEPEDDSDNVYASNKDHVPADDVTAPIRSSGKGGRNEPCPCGSGKKYKKCCGGRSRDDCASSCSAKPAAQMGV